jgi:flagella basal body P-ring formation protein FlgA
LKAHFEPTAARAAPKVPGVNKVCRRPLPLALAFVLALAGVPASAQALDAALRERVQALTVRAAQPAASGWRVEVRVGRLDARLRLAPCNDIQPYRPPGARPWGATRVGLRCADGAVRWNVFLPVTVDVFGPGVVAAAALPAGHVLTPGDLGAASVNHAAPGAAAYADAAAVIGRTLARPLAAGETLRERDVRARLWFAAGDTVRITAGGAGWRITGEGQALAAGVEGQNVRVRMESGRIVSGLPVADKQVEVPL